MKDFRSFPDFCLTFSPLSFLVHSTLLLILWNQTGHCEVFRDCGGPLEKERGVISSPNFPHPFPDPIFCLWVIKSPPGKKVRLYFTQYFLRESFYLTEYDFYTSPGVFGGRNDLGSINFQQNFTSLVSYKHVLTLGFHVHGKKNIHLRVDKFLNDVYGFNITYEVVEVDEPVRRNTCSVHDCSYLGHCWVSGDWKEFSCRCFEGFFGSACQYGPHCDPWTGKNSCLNGGSCMYFYGSTVNRCQCRPEFTGTYCETRKFTGDGQSNSQDAGCEEKPEAAELGCVCRDGYKLRTDSKSCELIGEMYRVTIDLTSPDTHCSEQDILARSFQSSAQHQLNGLLDRHRLPASQRFRINSFQRSESMIKLRFCFFMDSSSLDKLSLLLTFQQSLFNLTIHSMQVHTSPELALLGVENLEGRAASEGGACNLLCRARGSPNLQFHWTKDGQIINSSLTTRNIWHMRFNEGSGHSQTSILNINDVTIYDKGVFACEVEDFGDDQRQEIRLDVVTKPRVVITPLVANLRKGQAVSFRCFSPDVALRSVSYTWRKNGEPLNPRFHTEIVEELHPRGKQLNVLNARKGANYSCVVTSELHSNQATVYLFVTEKEGCEKSTALGVLWEAAVDGGFDRQNCPSPMIGSASRSCRCSSENGCKWSAPNLALCQSAQFIATFDKLEKIRLGYQGDSLADIYTELLALLHKRSDTLIAGDLTLASRMVLNGMTSLVDIPEILTQASYILRTELLLELLDFIMDWSFQATPEERKEQRIQARSLATLQLMAEVMGVALPLPENKPYRGNVLVAEIKEYVPYTSSSPSVTIVTLKSLIENRTRVTLPVKSSTYREKRTVLSDITNHRRLPGQPTDWLSYDYILPEDGALLGGWIQALEVVHMDFRMLSDIPYSNRSEDGAGVVLSSLHCVLPVKDLWETKDLPVLVTIPHRQQKTFHQQGQILCFALVVDSSHLDLSWNESACQVMFSGDNFTTCVCSLPVHVAVIFMPSAESAQYQKPEFPGTVILLMGCGMALCGVATLLLLYLLACRNLTSIYHMVRLNFILSLFLMLTICLTCLQGRHLVVLCITGKLLHHLALLAAFSFLFVDSIHMYLIVHAYSARVLTERCWKFLIIGWAIPVLSVSSTALTLFYYGQQDTCYHWCWIESQSWQFYPFVVPMLVLVAVCITISVKCVLTVYDWTDEWRFRSRKKHVMRAFKIVSLLVALLGVTWSGCHVEKENSYGLQIVFVLLLFLLVGLVYGSYCVLDKRVNDSLVAIIRPRRKGRLRQSCSSRSFRAFIMPENIEAVPQNTEEHSVHRLCAQRDHRRYTSAKKRQLRFLLGSSGSDSDESFRQVNVSSRSLAQAGERNVDNFEEEEDKAEGQTSDQRADSGVYTATESERSLSPGRCQISRCASSRTTGSRSDFRQAMEALLQEHR